jgi:hypothetical protein
MELRHFQRSLSPLHNSMSISQALVRWLNLTLLDLVPTVVFYQTYSPLFEVVKWKPTRREMTVQRLQYKFHESQLATHQNGV